MAKPHDPYTSEGRDALVRTIAYERRRHNGMVRAGIAERTLTALRDTHARPCMANPEETRLFDRISCEIANGGVAAVALHAVALVEMARASSARLLEIGRPDHA